MARDTTYDAMGHVSTVSEWYDESEAGTPAVTQYLDYDAFGRPTTIRPPDGASHDVTMSYTGDRVVQRTAKRMRGIKRDMAINPSRGEPVGVDVEVEP